MYSSERWSIVQSSTAEHSAMKKRSVHSKAQCTRPQYSAVWPYFRAISWASPSKWCQYLYFVREAPNCTTLHSIKLYCTCTTLHYNVHCTIYRTTVLWGACLTSVGLACYLSKGAIQSAGYRNFCLTSITGGDYLLYLWIHPLWASFCVTPGTFAL